MITLHKEKTLMKYNAFQGISSSINIGRKFNVKCFKIYISTVFFFKIILIKEKISPLIKFLKRNRLLDDKVFYKITDSISN